jgi:hypothetical protein
MKNEFLHTYETTGKIVCAKTALPTYSQIIFPYFETVLPWLHRGQKLAEISNEL